MARGYHRSCLLKLFGRSKVSTTLAYPRREFQQEVRKAVEKGRMSISGVQPKAQMTLKRLDLKNAELSLIVVNSGGEYILKPTPDEFPEAAINEHLSMQLARLAGFNVAECGLVEFKDARFEDAKFRNTSELAYIVRRFDRIGEQKQHHEDMMQIMGVSNSDTHAKYDAASYEEVLIKIRELAGLGVALEAFKRIVFNYFIGNDDYHLKNISLMHGHTLTLTPMYDCLNTVIYSSKTDSPLALKISSDDEQLPYYGKMGNGFYSIEDFMFLAQRVGIIEKPALKAIAHITKIASKCSHMINDSFLSEEYKEAYDNIIQHRKRLLSF